MADAKDFTTWGENNFCTEPITHIVLKNQRHAYYDATCKQDVFYSQQV
jgi:hypothetical protein